MSRCSSFALVGVTFAAMRTPSIAVLPQQIGSRFEQGRTADLSALLLRLNDERIGHAALKPKSARPYQPPRRTRPALGIAAAVPSHLSESVDALGKQGRPLFR